MIDDGDGGAAAAAADADDDDDDDGDDYHYHDLIINYILIIHLALSSYTQFYEKSDPPGTGGGGQATCRGWRSERGQSGRRRSLEKTRIWRENLCGFQLQSHADLSKHGATMGECGDYRMGYKGIINEIFGVFWNGGKHEFTSELWPFEKGTVISGPQTRGEPWRERERDIFLWFGFNSQKSIVFTNKLNRSNMRIWLVKHTPNMWIV